METVRSFLGNFPDIVSNRLSVGPSFLESGRTFSTPARAGGGGESHPSGGGSSAPFLALPSLDHCSSMLHSASMDQVTLLHMAEFTGASPLRSWVTANS